MPEGIHSETVESHKTNLYPFDNVHVSHLTQYHSIRIKKKKKEYMYRVPYVSIVGSLMYAMVCTRPNLAQVVSMVSRYMGKHGKEH